MSEVQHQSARVKIKSQQGWFLLEAPGENLLSLPVPKNVCIPWLVATVLQSLLLLCHILFLFYRQIFLFLFIDKSALLVRALVITFSGHRDNIS